MNGDLGMMGSTGIQEQLRREDGKDTWGRRTAGRREIGRPRARYLAFRLGNEEYGLELNQISELLSWRDITPLPGAPSVLRGVVDLRGDLLPVIDLRDWLEEPATEPTEESCILVLEEDGARLGIVADRAAGILELDPDEIDGTPRQAEARDAFLFGTATTRGRERRLLDLNKIGREMSVVMLSGRSHS